MPEDPDVLTAFETWMLSTDRAADTVKLRMRYVRELADLVHPLDATTEHIEQLLFRRRDDAPETRKSALSSWRLFYGFALRRKLRADDPTLDVESVRIPVRIPRVAPDEAIERGLRRATPSERAMVLLARYACLRLTELTTLHTRQREGDMLRILGKGDKERMVGVNDDLLDALRAVERAQGPGYYFPGLKGPHMHPQSVHKIIYRVTGYNPHALRHAGATAAYNETHDLRGVQAMLGHASLATTQRYLHLDADSLRRVAAATRIKPKLPLAA